MRIKNRVTSCYCFTILILALTVSIFAENAQVPALARVTLLLAEDNLVIADSLFRAYDLSRVMGFGDLSRWMRVKATLSRYGEAGHLACLALEKSPRNRWSVLYQMSEIIKDAKIDTIRAILRDFRLCSLYGATQRDTLDFKNWAMQTCGRFGLYEDEVDILVALDTKNTPSLRELFECARQRLVQGLFTQAIRPALFAFNHSVDPKQKTLCALMLYQAYSQVAKNDSAALWLSKVPLTQEKIKVDAAAFFQRTGYFEKADSLIKTMPLGFMRDTLTMRQFLFVQNVKEANALAKRVVAQAHSDVDKKEAAIWRIRSEMFGGNIGMVRALVDSALVDPILCGSAEILSYKYAVFIVGSQPLAGEDFGSVALASWASLPDLASKTLSSKRLEGYSANAKQLIVLCGAKTLIANKLYAQAQQEMARIELGKSSAEFRYYYAIALENTGAAKQARGVLEDLMLLYPLDVFYEKARMALMQLNNKN